MKENNHAERHYTSPTDFNNSQNAIHKLEYYQDSCLTTMKVLSKQRLEYNEDIGAMILNRFFVKSSRKIVLRNSRGLATWKNHVLSYLKVCLKP